MAKFWLVEQKASGILVLKKNWRSVMLETLAVTRLLPLILLALGLGDLLWRGRLAVDEVLAVSFIEAIIVAYILAWIAFRLLGGVWMKIEADRRLGRVSATVWRFGRRIVAVASNPQRFGLVFARLSKGAEDYWWLAAQTSVGVVKLACLFRPLASEAMDLLNGFFGAKTRPRMRDTAEILGKLDKLIPEGVETGGEEFDVLSRESLLREERRRKGVRLIVFLLILLPAFLLTALLFVHLFR